MDIPYISKNQTTKEEAKPVARKAKTGIEKMVCSKDWDCNTALAIAHAESGLDCNAVNHNTNKSTDRGVFQINSVHEAKYKGKDIFNCSVNIEVAYQIYKASGFNAWSTYKNKHYLKFYEN